MNSAEQYDRMNSIDFFIFYLFFIFIFSSDPTLTQEQKKIRLKIEIKKGYERFGEPNALIPQFWREPLGFSTQKRTTRTMPWDQTPLSSSPCSIDDRFGFTPNLRLIRNDSFRYGS